MSWLSLWIMEAVKPVGQLYGSATTLTSQYLAWDRYCTYVVQTPRVEKTNISGTNMTHRIAPEPREGDQSLIYTRSLLLNSHFAVYRNQTSKHMKNRNQWSFLQVSLSRFIVRKSDPSSVELNRTPALQNSPK